MEMKMVHDSRVGELGNVISSEEDTPGAPWHCLGVYILAIILYDYGTIESSQLVNTQLQSRFEMTTGHCLPVSSICGDKTAGTRVKRNGSMT